MSDRTKKPTEIKSFVGTVSGKVDGVFSKEYTPHETEEQRLAFLESIPSKENAVFARLEYLEERALSAFMQSGYEDWAEKVLIVDGARFTDPVPADLWDSTTSAERILEIIAGLGLKGRECEFGEADSLQPPLSLGYFAAKLRHNCKILRDKIAEGDTWSALLYMAKAENSLSLITQALMEADYIRGKRQRRRYPIDWDLALKQWTLLRPSFRSDAECDRALCKELGIASVSTVRNQRNRKKIT